MKIDYAISRQRSGISLIKVLALCSALPTLGCHEGSDGGVDADRAPGLQALLEDGPLPKTMASGARREPPPRFCNGGSDADGGVPSTDGGASTGGDTGANGSGSSGTGGSVSGGAGTNGSASNGVGGGNGAVKPVPVPVPGMNSNTGGTSPGSSAGDAGEPSDPGEPDASCADEPIGFWTFDDCNGFRTDLGDSSQQGHSAFRNVDLACVQGKEGQAVSFATSEDLVYAPDQPDFVLDQGVTVAAWVKPTRIDGVTTLFRKRDDADSAFALVINGKKFQFVIKLASGKLATVDAKAEAGVWTHVAATYDGTQLLLYKNGKVVSRSKAKGVLSRGTGPLLMGNDIKERRLRGQMDNAWFNTMAAPEATISELTCVHAAPTLAVTPAVGPASVAGTAVAYELTVTNRNSTNCRAETFGTFLGAPQDFSVDPQFSQTAAVPSGASERVVFNVASGEETEPGNYGLDFQVSSFGQFGTNAQARAEYVVTEATGCHVSSSRELMIRDVSVVEDPLRAELTGPANDPRTGAWTFGRLMRRLSPTAADAPDVTEAMFRTFLSPQSMNGFEISPRPAMADAVLQPWPRTADGKLDLARAPLRLLAIVNRLDLKDLSKGKAGEARLVYGVLDADGNSMEFTVIFEYALVAHTEPQARVWADAVHALQALPFPSEAYNAALQAHTDRVTARGALPGAPNGSTLIDIRTNEIALSFQWELREFHISATTGFMQPVPVAQTADASFNSTRTLARFINANEASILLETHDAPLSFEGAPFQAASIFNNVDAWDAPGINNPEARHKFSLNTCNGCHGGETQTSFLHVNPRSPGQPSALSGFLTGITVSDPVTGEPRRLAELKRRRLLLESVVCPTP